MGIDRNAFFREITRRSCGPLDVQEALDNVLNYLRYGVPADAIALVDRGDDRMARIVAWSGDRAILPAEPGAPLGIGLDGLEVGRPCEAPLVWRIGGPEDLSLEVRSAVSGLGEHPVVAIRLQVDGERIGLLWVIAHGPEAHTADDAELLATIREPLAIALRNALRVQALRGAERIVEATPLIGADGGLRPVLDQADRIADSTAPALLLGELGTGRELIARRIHQRSTRRSGPMAVLRCGALPEDALERQLFGHGAPGAAAGQLERAGGGTLFLDEVAALGASAQARLMRLLDEGLFTRVDEDLVRGADVRVIAATHRDLEALVRAGRFREDLWYRLTVAPVRIPPLRIRRQDIDALVDHFVGATARELGLEQVPPLSDNERERLRAYDWPGNVRELQNVVERAVILSRGGPLRFGELRSGVDSPDGAPVRLQTMAEAQRAHIRFVLSQTGGQVAGPGGAAEVLDMNPSTLRSRMKKLGMSVGA